MSAKPRTTPKDLVLSVPLARRPGAKARGLPRTVSTVRIPFCFSAISKDLLAVQGVSSEPVSGAGAAISLLNREKTGNFRKYSPRITDSCDLSG